MGRTAPSSQPYNRTGSSSSRHSRHPSSSGSISQLGSAGADNTQQTGSRSGSGSSSGSNQQSNKHATTFSRSNSNASTGNNSGNKKLTSTSVLPSLLSIPFMVLHMVYCVLKFIFGIKSTDDAAVVYPPQSPSRSKKQSSNVSDSSNGDINCDFDDIIKAVLERTKSSSNDGSSAITTTTTLCPDGLDEYLTVVASPALTTLLDDALYRAYQAELVPTVAAASRLLTEFIEMKEAAALVLRECRWMTGVPLSGGLSLHKVELLGDNTNSKGGIRELAMGDAVLNGQFLGEGAVVDEKGLPFEGVGDRVKISTSRRGSNDSSSGSSAEQAMHAEEISRWNEFDTIQDFARQCLLCANEAIARLTTDRLAEGANITLHESIEAVENREGRAGAGGDVVGAADGLGVTDAGGGLPHSSQTTQSASSTSDSNTPWAALQAPADAGIGRCYSPLQRKDCWESPRLYCPDYYWADDAIGGCQRLIKTLSKHRYISFIDKHGSGGSTGAAVSEISTASKKRGNCRIILPQIHASSEPHIFPSVEAAHALMYLEDLLWSSIPSCLNQFRAAAEANAVVSKRLYLVKCEYRAPMHALWESYANLNAAPSAALVERYLREYHGVKVGKGQEKEGGAGSSEGGSASNAAGEGASTTSGSSGGSSKLRRKGSVETVKKSAIQQQREKLEKLITEKYWKHPAFVEALQLERCCERMEIEMSQMLLPLSNLAAEIMHEWKGRLRAVAVVDSNILDEDEEVEAARGEEEEQDAVTLCLGYEQVPYMRELLRRLKSVLCRKPDVDESSGIRPLLLDLQGVQRHKADPIDASIEMPFYPQPLSGKPSLLERLLGSSDKTVENTNDPWFHLEKFLAEVQKLLELLNTPNIPCLVEERMAGSKGSKNTLLDLIEQINDVWDEEMFRAQYQDWYDMVQRQQKLNVGGGSGSSDAGTLDNAQQQPDSQPMVSLSELSETIREAEIELSIAMASKDQLERVHKRLEALRADKLARYKVLAQIVFDVGYRELNDGIVVYPPADDATVEFPKLSISGVFGEQLTMAGEVLPVG